MSNKPSQTLSHWQSNKRYRLARREHGSLTLVAHEGKYALINTGVEFFEAASLTEAIEMADRRKPPEGWDFVARMWISPHWFIKPVKGGGWSVFNTASRRMSKQVFERSDQARKWCEVRADRVGLSLRGPKPTYKKMPSEVCE